MTDNEIIQALECCKSSVASCEECPMYVEGVICHGYELNRKALELINRQHAAIERLKIENQSLRSAAITETKQSETKTEEKTKKKVYAIFYEQFFFGNHYDRYVQVIETEDIFHEVGVLIYKASTAVRNIRWCELHDVSVEAAIARRLSAYNKEDWKRINGTNILRFIGDNDI